RNKTTDINLCIPFDPLRLRHIIKSMYYKSFQFLKKQWRDAEICLFKHRYPIFETLENANEMIKQCFGDTEAALTQASTDIRELFPSVGLTACKKCLGQLHFLNFGL